MRKSRKVITEQDFRILLTFLGDANHATVALVKGQLADAIRRRPGFRRLLTDVPDPRLRRYGELFREELRTRDVEKDFAALFKQGPDLDLERGAYLLARME